MISGSCAYFGKKKGLVYFPFYHLSISSLQGFCFSFCSLKGEGGGGGWLTDPTTHFQERNGDWKPSISWVWPQVALGMKRIFKKAFAPMSDKDRISLYNVITTSSRQEIRKKIKKNIN